MTEPIRVLTEEEKRNLGLPTVLSEEERRAVLAPTVGGTKVDTSPFQVPGDIPVSGLSDTPFLPPRFAAPGSLQPNKPLVRASLAERALAAQGVDTRTGLQGDLRTTIGFSPNESFTADFLSRKLAERTGLPQEEVVRLLPTGEMVFFNPETRRYTAVDESNFTMADLKDMFGPAIPTSGAVAGGLIGSLGGPWASVGAGAGGALIGEIVRLTIGRDKGVHDMTDNEILLSAMKVGAVDAAVGGGSVGATAILKKLRNLFKPTGLNQTDAERILYNMKNNQGVVDDINSVLSRGGSDKRFVLTTAEQAEDDVAIAALDSAARASNVARGRRVAEMKDAESALEAATRVTLGLDEGAEVIARTSSRAAPAQRALADERRRLQSIADDSLFEAERLAREALENYGRLSQTAGGAEAKRILNLHIQTLENTKNNAWVGYQTAIGQPLGRASAAELKSNIQVPVTRALVDAYNASLRAVKQSLIDKKTLGPIALKQPKLGSSVDLAVLDENIKVLRRLKRSSSGDINTRQISRVEQELVNLRNDYLARNHPNILRQLDEAEAATTAYKRFVDDSIFARILTQDARTGKFIVNDAAAFRSIWNDKTGAAMGELINVAKRTPGGLAALRDTGYKVYAANVTPRGSNILNKKLHDKFVEDNHEILKQLYSDPSFYRFGKFADNVDRLSRRADRITNTLARSPLGRLGGANPEGMARAAFGENISISNIRSTMNVLESAGPEAVRSFRESAGTEVWRMLTTDGSLSGTKMTNLLQNHSEKLTLIFGDTFVRDLRNLRKGLNLSRQSVGGVQPKSSTLFGKLARAWITPPLTRRGRLQTFGEAFETQAMTRALNRALRDPDVLRAIVAQGNKDIRDKKVVAILSQIGATSLLVDDRILEE